MWTPNYLVTLTVIYRQIPCAWYSALFQFLVNWTVHLLLEFGLQKNCLQQWNLEVFHRTLPEQETSVINQFRFAPTEWSSCGVNSAAFIDCHQWRLSMQQLPWKRNVYPVWYCTIMCMKSKVSSSPFLSKDAQL